MVNKLKVFHSFVSVSDFQILAITETWCSKDVLDNEIFPPGYNVYRKDRDSRGGGVLLAVTDRLFSKLITVDAFSESIIVQVFLPQPIFLCVAYVPPQSSTSYLSSLFHYISTLCIDNNLILLGDFNSPDICWSTFCASNPFSCSLCEFIFDYNLHQLVEVSTHIKGNILDLVLTQSTELFCDLIVHSDQSQFLFSSDHFPISFSLSCSLRYESPPRQTYYQFHRGDYESMVDYIFSLNLDFFFNSVDVEFLWSSFKSIIWDCCEKFVPKSVLKSDRYPKWFDGAIRHK